MVGYSALWLVTLVNNSHRRLKPLPIFASCLYAIADEARAARFEQLLVRIGIVFQVVRVNEVVSARLAKLGIAIAQY